MDFKNAQELLTLCRINDMSISQVMRLREIEEGEMPAEEAENSVSERIRECVPNSFCVIRVEHPFV